MLTLITHADVSHVSKAIIRVCLSVILSVCLFVCTKKIKKVESTIIIKLGTGIVHHVISPINDKRSKVKIIGHKVQKVNRVVGVSYALYRVSCSL